jgi:hypothetical protein
MKGAADDATVVRKATYDAAVEKEVVDNTVVAERAAHDHRP